MSDIPPTSLTLLGRLRNDPGDGDAWATFAQRYGPVIKEWCLNFWELQEADAEDVSQEITRAIHQKIQSYDIAKNKRFRAWFKAVVHNAVNDYKENILNRAGRGSGDSDVHALLGDMEARADLESRLGKKFDLELLEEAMARVRLTVDPKTWDAFYLTAVEDLSGKEVAERLRLKVANVYVCRNRVQGKIKKELQRLEGETPESPDSCC